MDFSILQPTVSLLFSKLWVCFFCEFAFQQTAHVCQLRLSRRPMKTRSCSNLSAESNAEKHLDGAMLKSCTSWEAARAEKHTAEKQKLRSFQTMLIILSWASEYPFQTPSYPFQFRVCNGYTMCYLDKCVAQFEIGPVPTARELPWTSSMLS